MEEYFSLSRYNIESKLSEGHLLTSRIISLALTAGPLFFLLIIFFLYSVNKPAGADYDPRESIQIFVYVFIIAAIGVYGAFHVIPRFLLKPETLKNRLSQLILDQQKNEIKDPLLKLIFLDRTLMIIRLGLLEGVSFFGLVVLFLSVTMGNIYYEPLLWLLGAPVLIQVVYTIQNYVSKEKYLDRIENDLLIPLRSYSE